VMSLAVAYRPPLLTGRGGGPSCHIDYQTCVRRLPDTLRFRRALLHAPLGPFPARPAARAGGWWHRTHLLLDEISLLSAANSPVSLPSFDPPISPSLRRETSFL
jgi:hypothetical protein